MSDGTEQTNLLDLPESVVRKIFLDAYASDNVISEITDSLERSRIHSIWVEHNRREQATYQGYMDGAEPKSTMDLNLDVNAHQQLYRGSERFRDHHRDAADRREVQRRLEAEHRVRLSARVYFYNIVLNRLERNM